MMRHKAVLLCGLAVLWAGVWLRPGQAAEGVSSYRERYEAGQAQQAAGQQAAARAEFEKALASEGITPDQAGQALLQIADTHCREYKWQPANAALEQVIVSNGVSNAIKINARMAMGSIWANYGDWVRVKKAYTEALGTPGITPEQKTTAQKALTKALVNLREYAQFRAVTRELMTAATNQTRGAGDAVPRVVLKEFVAGAALPDAERAAMQVSIAKTFMAERNYAEARAEFAKAQAMPGLSDGLKAEIQLYIGLSYYDAQDYDYAKPELMKVLNMPGAWTRPPWDGGRMGYVPAREANLRLRFRNLVSDTNKVLKVLFIGSSHTLRENIPELVTQLAASAPADRLRILAGDYVRMGTPLNTFWEAGDTPDTARGVIAADPWDAVVFETFYNMNSNVIMKYGSLAVDLIRRQKAAPVVYESPLPQASPYPDRFQGFHDDNVALMKAVKVAVAPSVRAWMEYLGPKPTPDQFGAVYADWIHAAPKGAYMTACCIYAALTGQSPVGLYHPDGISEPEAKKLQEFAWEAYRETNAAGSE